MVVTERLNQVATQLAKVNQTAKMDEMAMEDELLNEDPKSDTPVRQSRSSSPKATGSPAEVANTNESIDDGESGGRDTVADRVNHIFGSKRRAIEDDEYDASPKVANIVAASGSGNNDNGTGPGPLPENAIVKDPQPPGGMEIDGDVGHDEPEADPEIDHDGDQEGDNDLENEDGEWVDGDDNPEDFPDIGFPMQVPGYPMQPIFQYRYRTPNSNPRGRRIDFDRSIVLRRCERDRHTGRIAQEEYEARENSEMALSLG